MIDGAVKFEEQSGLCPDEDAAEAGIAYVSQTWLF